MSRLAAGVCRDEARMSTATSASTHAFLWLTRLIQCGMRISEEALSEFIELYKKEFNEDIDRDQARIIARNLVTFYLDLEEGGVFQAARESEEEEPEERPAIG
jgi:hypothetical protein